MSVAVLLSCVRLSEVCSTVFVASPRVHSVNVSTRSFSKRYEPAKDTLLSYTDCSNS
jgi:hypothetical protein